MSASARRPRVIAVCGKGGVGKTAFTALLLRALVADGSGGHVLAIDADPALGLAVSLGVSPDRTIGDVRERVIRAAQRRSPDAERELARELDYHIMEALVERDDFAFLAMGRAEALGCFCPVNDMLRGGIELLGGEYDTILVDGEAGIEQINRHVLPRVDALLLLTDGSVRGGRTVELLADIAVAEGVVAPDAIGIIVNRLPAAGGAVSIPTGIPVLGRVPQDETVADFDARGLSLLGVPEASPAATAVEALARALFPMTPTPSLTEALP